MDTKLNIQGMNDGSGIKVEYKIYKIMNIVQNPQRTNKKYQSINIQQEFDNDGYKILS